MIDKPSCLFAKPPTSLESLLSYTEQDLVKALPINHTYEWLLPLHVPYLLSFKPNENSKTLMGCIHTALNFAKKSTKLWAVYDKFLNALQASEAEFQRYNDAKCDAKDIPYSVLEPKYNAVSILI